MKHTILKLVTAAMIISATALFVGGCSNKAQDIDLTLIGGDGHLAVALGEAGEAAAYAGEDGVDRPEDRHKKAE